MARPGAPCYSPAVDPTLRRKAGTLIAGLALLSAASSVAVRAGHLGTGASAALCFLAVVAAAMLISWSAEAAQFFVSQGLAVAVIALLQVLPEFMVEAVIAWEAGKTGQVDLVFANATGSNRLLTGLGWPLIFFVADFFHRRRQGRPLDAIRLRPENAVELVALLFASSWYLVVLWKGSLTLLDSAVLGSAFLGYLWLLHRLPAEDAEKADDLLPEPRLLVELRRPDRTLAIGGLMLLSGATMVAVAEPFVEAMAHVALATGISHFAFVQWVAPFLTEFPEKVTALYWARTVRLAPMALLNMVSSTVNQYTALVAMIPVAYALSAGHAEAIVMDPLHRTELFLSFATTLFGVACLAKLRFTRTNAIVMLALFVAQFVYSGPLETDRIGLGGLGLPAIESHAAIAWAYVILAVAEVSRHGREIRLWGALRETLAVVLRPRPPASGSR